MSLAYNYIALRCVKGVTDSVMSVVLSKRGTLSDIFKASYDELYSYNINSIVCENIIAKKFNEKFVDNELNLALKNNIKILTYEEDAYPKLLKEIAVPPQYIYVRGSLSHFDKPAIAVVGSRKCSKASSDFARRIGADLAEVGFSVVAGYAYGIDIAAHLGAITKGSTIAVLGSGLENIYPQSHTRYVESVLENGAFVSEFLLNEPPLPANFPRRNRIISGLSLGVLVVEASHRSGSLITTRFATEQNREIFAVPQFPTSFNSAGNKLIKDGAKLVENYLDIVNEFAHLFVSAKKVTEDKDIVLPVFDNNIKHDIYKALLLEPLSMDEVCIKLDINIVDALTSITELELEGYISRDENDSFIIGGD